jgi:hypothetical protein
MHVDHDRIHARKPTHDIERWSTGILESLDRQDGHCVVEVRPEGDGDERVQLTVTLAVRDLFLDRLELEDGVSPVGERIWYRERGG